MIGIVVLEDDIPIRSVIYGDLDILQLQNLPMIELDADESFIDLLTENVEMTETFYDV